MKLLNKAIDFFGLTAEQEEKIPVSCDTSEHRYPSFAQELPYKYFDAKNHIFHNEYNCGIIYQNSPLTGGNEMIAEQLDSIIRNKISNDFTLHVIQARHNQVGHKIERFSDQFRQDGLNKLSKLGDSLESYYKNATKHGFKTKNTLKQRILDTEVYLVIDVSNKGKDEAELVGLFNRFCVSFQASLSASNIGFRKCDAYDFLHLKSLYLNHDPKSIYPTQIKYDENELLKYQVTNSNFALSVDDKTKDHLILEGRNEDSKPYKTAITVLTLDKVPTEFHIWDNINSSANIFDFEYSVPCNHIITATYLMDDQGKALTKANRKTRDLSKKANSSYATMVAGTEEQAQNWKSFREDLTKQKTGSCKMLYNVVLFSDPSSRLEDTVKTLNAFKNNALELSVCTRMQVPYFLSTMPFLFTNNLQYDFSLPKMMHHISSWNATQYLPLLSDWQGQENGIMLPTMRGQMALVNSFSNYFGTNYNINVTGASGAGKSFVMQMMALSTLFDGGYIYIIDIGGSYRKLCDLVGGVYLEYDNLAMNPFTYATDIGESIDELVDLFELLACPKDGARDTDSAVLRKAIIEAYSQHSTNTLVDHVQEALYDLFDINTFPTANSLAENLSKFTSKAEHGKAFNLPSQLDPKARFVVVDLEQIKSKNKIITPVLYTVLTQYRARIYKSDRNVKKSVICDEAWTFFKGNPKAIEFLIEGFRTARRFNAQFITITQGINDYFSFEEATALWDSAALKIILLQDLVALNDFNKEHEMFNEYEMSVIKKFPEAKKTGYSELQIVSSNVKSFHRLFVDPFTLVMLSSSGDDYSAVQKLVKTGLPLLDAVEQVAHKHYGDMYHEET
jgi:conjugal transfer ATP-binding protein TraC